MMGKQGTAFIVAIGRAGSIVRLTISKSFAQENIKLNGRTIAILTPIEENRFEVLIPKAVEK